MCAVRRTAVEMPTHARSGDARQHMLQEWMKLRTTAGTAAKTAARHERQRGHDDAWQPPDISLSVMVVSRWCRCSAARRNEGVLEVSQFSCSGKYRSVAAYRPVTRHVGKRRRNAQCSGEVGL
jgi:hypothetical protein